MWLCVYVYFTCFPSMADFISLKVVWNSPMKSCFPLESQSHTVHYNKKQKCKKANHIELTIYIMFMINMMFMIQLSWVYSNITVFETQKPPLSYIYKMLIHMFYGVNKNMNNFNFVHECVQCQSLENCDKYPVLSSFLYQY